MSKKPKETGYVTFEIDVGTLGSELHRKLQLGVIPALAVVGLNYSAGGDPYMVRIVTVVEAKKEFVKVLKGRGFEGFKVLKGAQPF